MTLIQLCYILLAVYLVSVNVYSFLLVRTMKKRAEDRTDERRQGNAKLLIAALLGGAAAAYAALFAWKFRTDNLLLMIALPVLAALNIYLIVTMLRNGLFLLPV